MLIDLVQIHQDLINVVNYPNIDQDMHDFIYHILKYCRSFVTPNQISKYAAWLLAIDSVDIKSSIDESIPTSNLTYDRSLNTYWYLIPNL
jgi:hypothetical protein